MYEQQITQVVNTSADLTLRALKADGDLLFIGDPSGETSVPLTVQSVTIYNAAHQDITAAFLLQDINNITVDAAGVITLRNMEQGYFFKVTSDNSFSAFQITSVDLSRDTFKLGLFAIGTVSDGRI